MLESQQVEELISLVSAMDRPTLVAQFRAFRASFPVDFTDHFLEATPLEHACGTSTSPCASSASTCRSWKRNRRRPHSRLAAETPKAKHQSHSV